MTGYRILILETREEAQFSRLLAEQGADVMQCPMFTINDAPDAAPVEAWIRRFIERPCDDLVLMTGEGLRRLMKVVRRLDVEKPFVAALAHARKFARGPKPVRALRELGLEAQVITEKPTSEGIAETLGKLDLKGRRLGLQLYPEKDHAVLIDAITAQGAQRRYRPALRLRLARGGREHRRRDRGDGGRPHRCDRADQSGASAPAGGHRQGEGSRGTAAAGTASGRRSPRSARSCRTSSRPTASRATSRRTTTPSSCAR